MEVYWPTFFNDRLLFSVFDVIEQHAPGFKASVIGRDVLAPPDLEKIFGLTGGVRIHVFC